MLYEVITTAVGTGTRLGLKTRVLELSTPIGKARLETMAVVEMCRHGDEFVS